MLVFIASIVESVYAIRNSFRRVHWFGGQDVSSRVLEVLQGPQRETGVHPDMSFRYAQFDRKLNDNGVEDRPPIATIKLSV